MDYSLYYQTQTVRVNPSQILRSYSFALDTATASAEAIEAAASAHQGRCPDAFFLCAGASKPMFYVETSEQDHIDGMTSGYWVQAWSAFVRVCLIRTIPLFIY